MPNKVTSLATAGEVYGNPFIGPVNHTIAIRADVSELSSYEVDAQGYLKPGVILTRAGKLPGAESYIITDGTLAIATTAKEKYQTSTAMVGVIAGQQFSKAAQNEVVFSAAHTVTALKHGVILVQVNAAGTLSTKVPLATQAYDTAALALAALPAADANNVAVGYITIHADAGNWVANTDDMTNGSDLTAATFVDAPETLEELNIGMGYGAVVEAVKVATGNTDVILDAAADTDVAVALICVLNREIVEDNLGRALTTAELANTSPTIVITAASA